MSTNASMVSASLDGAIEQAVEKLMAGDLVAVPTETVYGLAADALNGDAVAKIFNVKGRPAFNPLICHVASPEMAADYVQCSETAGKLMAAFWPGPLTIVSKSLKHSKVAPAVSAGLETLAVRCPDNDVTRNIIHELGHPIAAPSANKSGKLSPTTAASVAASVGAEISLIIDGGPTDVGIESTIVSIEDDKITLLRPGTITADDIVGVVGGKVLDRDSNVISAPGQLASHYAPAAPVLLNQTAPSSGIFVGFGDVEGDYNLSPSGNLAEAARNLFEILRKADIAASDVIAVAPIPNEGIGIAINDRLRRAAAPRPDASNA